MEKYVRSQQKKAKGKAIEANNDEQFEEKMEQLQLEADMFARDMEIFTNMSSGMNYENAAMAAEEELFGFYI